MSATNGLLRAALVFGTTAALAVGALGGTALADPPATTFPTLAGVGSDTIQDWGTSFANGSAGLVASFDATPSQTYIHTRSANGATETFNNIVTGSTGTLTLPAGSILRPDGSGAGVSALRASLGDPSLTTGNWITQVGPRNSFKQVPAGSIDFARSSSGPSAPNADGDLVYVPFAKDAVTWAKKTGDTTLPENFSKADLISLYKCVSVTIAGITYNPNLAGAGTATEKPVRPMVPQAGSGTRTFWGAQLNFPVGSGLLPSCVKDVDSNGVPVQEHNGTALRNNGDLIPFSVPSWIAQSNSATLPDVIDRRNGAALQSIDGTAPITASSLTPTFPILRDMYVVVDWAAVNDPTTNVYKAFNSDSASFNLCDTGRITSYGFGVIAYCGALLPTNRAFDFKASPTATATVLSAAPVATQVEGNAVTFTATVSGGATGTVTFKAGPNVIGTAPVTAGVATLVKTDLPVGAHSVVATFASNTAAFTGSISSAVSYTITAVTVVVPTTTTVALSKTSTAYNSAVTATVTVAGTGVTPAGTVSIKDGTKAVASKTLSAGKATFTLPADLSVGTHSLTASYAGSAEATASTSAAASLVVTKAASTVKVSLSKTSIAYGATAVVATISVTGAGRVPTGTVVLKDGTKSLKTVTLVAGKGKITLSKTLSVKVHSLQATYSGNSVINTGKSAVVKLTVKKATPSVTAKLAAVKVKSTTKAKVTASVKVAGVYATGVVRIREGSKTLAVATLKSTNKGVLTFSLPKLKIGKHKIAVSYAGSSVVAAKISASVTLTVVK